MPHGELERGSAGFEVERESRERAREVGGQLSGRGGEGRGLLDPIPARLVFAELEPRERARVRIGGEQERAHRAIGVREQGGAGGHARLESGKRVRAPDHCDS